VQAEVLRLVWQTLTGGNEPSPHALGQLIHIADVYRRAGSHEKFESLLSYISARSSELNDPAFVAHLDLSLLLIEHSDDQQESHLAIAHRILSRMDVMPAASNLLTQQAFKFAKQTNDVSERTDWLEVAAQASQHSQDHAEWTQCICEKVLSSLFESENKLLQTRLHGLAKYLLEPASDDQVRWTGQGSVTSVAG
jgi:hypothetical protein